MIQILTDFRLMFFGYHLTAAMRGLVSHGSAKRSPPPLFDCKQFVPKSQTSFEQSIIIDSESSTPPHIHLIVQLSSTRLTNVTCPLASVMPESTIPIEFHRSTSNPTTGGQIVSISYTNSLTMDLSSGEDDPVKNLGTRIVATTIDAITRKAVKTTAFFLSRIFTSPSLSVAYPFLADTQCMKVCPTILKQR